MKGQAIILKPGETLEIAQRFPFDKPVELPFLNGGVGGPIEAVPLFDRMLIDGAVVGVVVFCHEEGKLIDLPFNRAATTAWMSEFNTGSHAIDDVLVGPVVILTGDEDFLAEI